MKDREQFEIPRAILWLRVMYLPCLSKLSTTDGLLGCTPQKVKKKKQNKTVGQTSITHVDFEEIEKHFWCLDEPQKSVMG